MTIVFGRRRIGKTSLILKSVEDIQFIYLFVSRKEEVLICADFITVIEIGLSIKVHGSFNTIAALFDYLMELSFDRKFTLIIDEFQELNTISPSVFSEMQQIWDRKKNRSQLNLILSGSVIDYQLLSLEDLEMLTAGCKKELAIY